MTRFPTAAHLAPGPGSRPASRNPPAAPRQRSTGHGNRYLASVLGEAAVAASEGPTPSSGERYRRIARRRGKKKATVAVGRSILVIVWHLLNDPEAHFTTSAPTFTTPDSAPNAPHLPRPPTPGPGIPGHPATSRLTIERASSSPAPPEAVACPLTLHFRISRVHRPRPRPLRPPPRHPTRDPVPHPPTPGAGLPGHPATSRLTHANAPSSPATPDASGLPTHLPFSD